MVVNIGHVLVRRLGLRRSATSAPSSMPPAAHGAITKVIFETGLLPNDDIKIRLCEISEAAGAAFVKTSTGFGFVKGAGRRAWPPPARPSTTCG